MMADWKYFLLATKTREGISEKEGKKTVGQCGECGRMNHKSLNSKGQGIVSDLIHKTDLCRFNM